MQLLYAKVNLNILCYIVSLILIFDSTNHDLSKYLGYLHLTTIKRVVVVVVFRCIDNSKHTLIKLVKNSTKSVTLACNHDEQDV